MATIHTFRKAYGAIKDSTKVGLAHVNSDYAELDVAIVKATSHVERPPKERSVRKILLATSAIRPRADVAYCIHGLSLRLAKTRNWTVALKTLIVIHRLLRDGDPTFREELLSVSPRENILYLSDFKDDSSSHAWDYSAWVRTYALFLVERLECFRSLKYDIEAENLQRTAQGQEKGYSKIRALNSEELLEKLPALQQLLYRLVGCQPEGAAVGNFLVQYALALVLKESFKVYCAVNDGIINLVDKFFEMPRHEAMKAFDIYKRAAWQAGSLSGFYMTCRGLELARNFQFPVLREPPQSFLITMEEYIREAPRVVSVPTEPLLQLTYKPETEIDSPQDAPTVTTDDPDPETAASSNNLFTSHVEIAPPPMAKANPPVIAADTGDLLGFSDASSSSIDEKNALALAIVSSGIDAAAAAPVSGSGGWELALISEPSTNAAVTGMQLAGGLDALTLNSLYDDAAYRATQHPVYGAPGLVRNPFEARDHPPLGMPGDFVPSPAHEPAVQFGYANPFGDPLIYRGPFHDAASASSNPFGNTHL